MTTWRFFARGWTYEVTNYGPRIGIQVTRDGYTVWAGYKEGGRFATHTSTLPRSELLAVLEGLARHDPDRREQPSSVGRAEALPEPTGRAGRAQGAPVQLDLLGGHRGAAVAPDSSWAAFAALGPLFSRLAG